VSQTAAVYSIETGCAIDIHVLYLCCTENKTEIHEAKCKERQKHENEIAGLRCTLSVANRQPSRAGCLCRVAQLLRSGADYE
jgi:hypothetical protein